MPHDADAMTLAQVAMRLAVSTGTVRNLVANGDLPAFLVGRRWRVRRADLEAWVRRQQDAARNRGRRARLLRGGPDTVPAFLRQGSAS